MYQKEYLFDRLYFVGESDRNYTLQELVNEDTISKEVTMTMKNRRLLTVVVMAAALACTMTACGFGDKEDESQIVVETEATPTPEAEPTPTIAADVQTTTYTSANKMISIDLPDATWSVKYDEEDMWSFESPGVGKILILYGSGEDDMSSTVMPNTEDMAISLEAAAGMEYKTDFIISDYTAKEKKGANIYTYAAKYYDTEKSGGYAYSVNRVFANDNEYFSIVGSVKNKDSFTPIKDAIKTFKIGSASTLHKAAPMTETAASGDTSDGAGTTASEANDTVDTVTSDSTEANGGFTEEELNDTSKTRTLYDNTTGKGFVVYVDSNGNWVDKSGNTYEFVSDEDAYDQNGVSYYYHGESANVYYMPVE